MQPLHDPPFMWMLNIVILLDVLLSCVLYISRTGFVTCNFIYRLPSTSSRPQWFPCRLVFSYQLYCLPVTRIKCRLITPCQPHVPHLLYMEKDVNMPASHEACIVSVREWWISVLCVCVPFFFLQSVHDFTLPVSTSTASKEVLQYLKKGWLSVTVYDGDSLIVVGTALIPTRVCILTLTHTWIIEVVRTQYIYTQASTNSIIGFCCIATTVAVTKWHGLLPDIRCGTCYEFKQTYRLITCWHIWGNWCSNQI